MSQSPRESRLLPLPPKISSHSCPKESWSKGRGYRGWSVFFQPGLERVDLKRGHVVNTDYHREREVKDEPWVA